MSEVIKNGKVSMLTKEQEKAKYTSATVDTSNALTIPEHLAEHFKDIDVVGKWVSKHRLASNGGRHPGGWIPYEMNDMQKSKIDGFGAGVINGVFLERGDMVLAVKPIQAYEAAAKALKVKTDRQIGAYEELTDAAGNKMLDRGKPGHS